MREGALHAAVYESELGGGGRTGMKWCFCKGKDNETGAFFMLARRYRRSEQHTATEGDKVAVKRVKKLSGS